MKRLFFLIGISMMSFWSNAQEIAKESKLDRNVRDWSILKDDELLSIEFRFADCDPQIGFDKEIIQLRYTNKSDQKVEVNWHVIKYYNGVCTSCDYPEEYSHTLMMEPGQVLTGDCELDYDPRLVIFSRFLNAGSNARQQLTNFELKGINIKSIK